MLTQVVFTKEFTIRAGLSGATPAGRAPWWRVTPE
jgi:hypothetical protein